ncbi:HEPN domain-containing protein [Sphingobacterium pedocola]|uniref:HEPN domain-containing protein n=1 Tax=Sphingobacterium pedocola TaxID=2082722 RepID=A0ABR9T3B9_9SPHI|nr:HEPN domain-containing protein [Sphingobacterium pedocola]MBE8719837.1 hypothetical protein [Sphingobacterium pedocola]
MIVDTQFLIDRLVQRIDVERIYKFSFPSEEGEQPRETKLLLVVNPVKGMAPNALAPIVSLCMSDMEEEIPFDMIIAGEWSNKIKQGSLYHTYVSLPEHLCYASKKISNALFSGKNLSGLLELAQYNYNKSKAISDEFRLGVDNFLTKEDYTQATYMLHQFVETRLKAFQATVGIKASKGHNLEHLFRTVRGISPILPEIFAYDSSYADLLRKLDQSYVKTLKWEQIDMTKDEFEVLLHTCELARYEMDKRVTLMVSCVTAYRDKMATEKTDQEQSKTAPAKSEHTGEAEQRLETKNIVCEDFGEFPWLQHYKADTNKLLDKIRTNHNPEQVIMLNYHTGGFSGSNLFQQENKEKDGIKVELYLVVIMKNTGPFHFKCMQVGVTSAMVVFMSVKDVEKKLAVGDRFVHTLWTKGHVLRRKSTFEPSFDVGEVDWNGEYERMKKVSETAKNTLIEISESLAINNVTEEVLLFCVVKGVLESAVISYICCAVGYLPKNIPLRDLIDWTGVIDRQIIEFLYRRKESESFQLGLLLRPNKIWGEGMFHRLLENSFLNGSKTAKYVNFFNDQFEIVLKQLKEYAEPEPEPA